MHDWLLAAPVQLRPSAQSCYDFMIPMAVPCLAGGISHYLLPLTPFMASPALFPEPWWGGINILSRIELLSTTHSQYLGQLWVSAFTSVHWLGPAGRFIYGYKHWCLEGNLPSLSKTPGVSFLLGPMAWAVSWVYGTRCGFLLVGPRSNSIREPLVTVVQVGSLYLAGWCHSLLSSELDKIPDAFCQPEASSGTLNASCRGWGFPALFQLDPCLLQPRSCGVFSSRVFLKAPTLSPPQWETLLLRNWRGRGIKELS